MKLNSRIAITAVPLVLVNTVAILGQYAALRQRLPDWGVPGAVLFAVALESIAVFLAAMAHESLLANDSALRLRLASYAAGIGIGVLNASHYLHDGRLTFEGIGVGIMSALSPMLWAIYSRRASRDVLIKHNLIERRATKLGATRWMLYPVKAFRVFRLAAWSWPEALPATAIGHWERRQEKLRLERESAAEKSRELPAMLRGVQ
jgi:hypothetical protein